MNNNTPYVLEVAAMLTVSEREGRDTQSLREAAAKNNVTDEQLEKALEQVRALPDQTAAGLARWSREQYLSDGRAKGYVGPDDEPTAWVLGQLAHNHYGE